MKLTVFLIIIPSLLLQLISPFCQAGDELSCLFEEEYFSNTLHASKAFFLTWCISASVKIVTDAIAPDSVNTFSDTSQQHKQHRNPKKKNIHFLYTFNSNLDTSLSNVFGGLTASNTIFSKVQVNAFDLFYEYIAFYIYFESFLICIMFLMILYLLPRGAIDKNYLIHENKNL
ncbi:MAG: hypothetical protein JW871_01125 [Endomicrobiales bacterium]|nr:hypothetical protein [Endomicrobiales bacterium]